MMNRRNHIIGIAFVAVSLSLSPAMGMNLFQKTTDTAKKITRAVVDTGAKAAANVVVGVAKVAGTIEDNCTELSDRMKQKISHHERNKQINIPDHDAIPNSPINEVIDAPQASLLYPEQKIHKIYQADKKNKTKKKKNKSSKGDFSDSSSSFSSSSSSLLSSSDSDNNLSDTNSTELNNCSLFDDKKLNSNLYQICKRIVSANDIKTSEKLTKESLESLNPSAKDFEFKAALISLAYEVVCPKAFLLWAKYSLNEKLDNISLSKKNVIFDQLIDWFKDDLNDGCQSIAVHLQMYHRAINRIGKIHE